MLKKIKELRYKSQEQLELYKREKEKLTLEDKYRLVNQLLDDNIFAYLELIPKIALDIAEVTDSYLELLEKITSKIKKDMAQGYFLDMLKEIGYKKEKIALELYKKIISKSKEEYLKTISGLILGGYSVAHEKEFKEMIQEKGDSLELISYLKAIIVLYEKSDNLPDEVISFLDKIESSKEPVLLRELANVSLVLYNKNPKYFYKKIELLVQLNDLDINYLIFSRLSYTKVIDKLGRFNLIELIKDSREEIIDEVIQILKEYPEETEKIGSLFIYWTNKGLEFKLRNYSWIIEELAKKNKRYIDYFLDNLLKINNFYFVFPHMFVLIAKDNIHYSIDRLLYFQKASKVEDRLFYELVRKVIGSLYLDPVYYDDLIILLERLLEISKGKKFISINLSRISSLKNKPTDKINLKISFDELVNITYNLLTQLQSNKEGYDSAKVLDKIKKYPQLYALSKEIILTCEKDNKYSPLLWLGEREEPSKEEVKINKSDTPLLIEIKKGFMRSKLYPRAYLNELESSISLYKSLPNGKFKQKNIEDNIKKNFLDEPRFWTFLSEVIALNTLHNKGIKILEIEPKVPNRPENNLDLKINLFNRDTYLEITRPELDRSLRLSNEAVGLSNKSFSVIDRKYGQIFSDATHKEIQNGKRKDLFFVVIDATDSTIDEYGLLNSFFGSLAYTMLIDKKTGKMVDEYSSRQPDSLGDKNPKTEIVSGVIYYKQNLSFIKDQPRISLVGDVILNPNAINTLTEKELQELKKLLFVNINKIEGEESHE